MVYRVRLTSDFACVKFNYEKYVGREINPAVIFEKNVDRWNDNSGGFLVKEKGKSPLCVIMLVYVSILPVIVFYIV